MSASFFDLMKYASTGIASPSMTAYDKMRALAAFGGGKTQTITGVPPLSFKANGKPLISWSMKGNGQQSGTPTPDAPIMPEFVGVRTANMMPAGEKKTIVCNDITFDSDGSGRYRISGTASADTSVRFNLVSGFTTPISVSNGGQGTLSFFNTQKNEKVSVVFYNGTTEVDDWKMTPKKRTHVAYNTIGNKYVDNVMITVTAGSTVDMIITPEFTNDGVLPTEFEPYGWAEYITCAGQTVPVYLGQTQTVRRIKKLVLTGEEQYWWSATYWSSSYVYYNKISTTLPQPISDIGICSHFKQRNSQTLSSGEFNIRFTPENNHIAIGFGKEGFATLDDFKAYLAQQYTNGTPVTIWYVIAEPETAIVNEPLCKIGDYADELHSEDAGVTIPTAKGQNTLTVDTELQPSEMSVTGHIKSS